MNVKIILQTLCKVTLLIINSITVLEIRTISLQYCVHLSFKTYFYFKNVSTFIITVTNYYNGLITSDVLKSNVMRR